MRRAGRHLTGQKPRGLRVRRARLRTGPTPRSLPVAAALAVLAVPSAMSGGVVAITLVAAVLHAVWNAVAHAITDRLVGFALIGVAYVVVGGIGALVLGPPPAAAWPFILASALIHVVYTVLLWASYQLGEFSQVYPVARGTAPLVVAVVEVVLGHALPVLQLVGIVVISLGLISLALDGGRLSRAALPALGAAVATGICIAGYTVIDAGAVSTTPVLVYAAWVFLLQGPVLPLIALLRRGPGVGSQARPVLAAGLGGGVVSLAAYGLVLVAQTSGATAAVAALRETSIIIGAILGAIFLGECFGLQSGGSRRGGGRRHRPGQPGVTASCVTAGALVTLTPVILPGLSRMLRAGGRLLMRQAPGDLRRPVVRT